MMEIKPCVDCGTEFLALNGPRSRRCKPCQRAHKRSYNRAYHATEGLARRHPGIPAEEPVDQTPGRIKALRQAEGIEV